MRALTTLGFAAISTWLASCGFIPAAPGEYAGNVRLVIDNEVNTDLCEFSLTSNGITATTSNWLRRAWVVPGATYSFDVKPGVYTASVSGGCHSPTRHFHGETSVTITGTTYMTVTSSDIDGNTDSNAQSVQLLVDGDVSDYTPPS